MSKPRTPKYEPPIEPDLDADPVELDGKAEFERLRRMYGGEAESADPEAADPGEQDETGQRPRHEGEGDGGA